MANIPRPRPFTPVDATWLHLEMPASTTLIIGLLLFEEPVDFVRVRDQLMERLLQFDRFRQRPRVSRLPFALPTWEPMPDFDWDAHIHCIKLPGLGDWAQLKAFIEGLLAAPLPRDRPVWQMYFVERYGAGSALISCYSHVMADGFASMHILEALTDPTPDAEVLPLLQTESQPPGQAVDLAGRIAAALDAAASARGLALRLTRLPSSAVQHGLELARDPGPALRQAEWALEYVETFWRNTLKAPDRWTPLRGRPSHARRVAASEPISLAELKRVAHVFDATVNDLLAAAVSGGLRRYLVGRGVRVDGLTIQASMPYNLRPAEDSRELGNVFTLVYLPMPVGIADPLERLQAVKRYADGIKGSASVSVDWDLLRAVGYLPETLSRLAVLFYSLKVTCVLTNVPGLPDPRYLAGHRIGRVMFWVPTPGMLSTGVSLLTYAGNATVCVSTDARMVPDPEAIVAGFSAEYAELKRRADLASESHLGLLQ